MKILYYCQHVLGIGHFHRSTEICRALSDRHEVTMVVGGPDVSSDELPFTLFQLPCLKMDDNFNGLEPCSPGPSLESIKQDRTRRLLDFYDSYTPDAVIMELYPFGRKAFRFELDPLLSRIREDSRKCRVFCSLRDILVEKKEGREKFEKRAVDTLNTWFDALFIHADPAMVKLDQTFARVDEIAVPVYYTGFITPKPTKSARKRIRQEYGAGTNKRQLIVASIGSGSVGGDLLLATARAAALLHDQGADNILQIFTGPYLEESISEKLLALQSNRIRVSKYANNFIDWLAAADLSVSMAGYNTFMNSLAAGVPSLMHPFQQNREQRMRINAIKNGTSIRLLENADLAPQKFADLLREGLCWERYTSPVKLDGAERTANLVETIEI